MMNIIEMVRILSFRVFNGGDYNSLIIYGGYLFVNVYVFRLFRLWRNKKNYLVMYFEF